MLAAISYRQQEYEVIIQSQRNMLFQLFGIWQTKTKVSLPYAYTGLLTYIKLVFARPQISRISFES